jgi:hypothetical protein
MVKASEKWARPRFFGGKGGLSGLINFNNNQANMYSSIRNILLLLSILLSTSLAIAAAAAAAAAAAGNKRHAKIESCSG